MANICTTPFDRCSNAAPLQGKRVCDWVSTVTTHPDFTAENHGFVHPNYMSSGILLAGWYALHYGLAGQPVPDVARFNRQPLYEVLKTWTETDGTHTPVQGQDWWYTTRAVFDSVGGGHFFAPNPEQLRLNQFQTMRTAERGAAASLTATYLLHRVFGNSTAPVAQHAFDKRPYGTHVLPHGGLVVRRGRGTFASFSWRNKPVVLMQPASAASIRTVSHHVDDTPAGLAATAAIERGNGALLQRYALVAMDDDCAVYFENTVAQRDITVLNHRGGEVAVRNEWPAPIFCTSCYESPFKNLR